MANFGWLTDIHLDHLKDDKSVIDFANKQISNKIDGYFITGDISNSIKLIEHLSILESAWQKPINFVLGNHDYWYSTMANVKTRMTELMKISTFLKYVPANRFTPLTNETAVVGADGWYDGLNGNALSGQFLMNDWFYIGEFNAITKGAKVFKDINIKRVVELSQKIAMESVTHMFDAIKDAARHHKHIIVLTHIPPWEQAHVYKGQKGDSSAQPWFTSKLMGQLLEKAADTFPNVMFTVLAGHTHGEVSIQVKRNMTCMVGGADYGSPKTQQIIPV